MAKKTLTFPTWSERVDGPNDELGIEEGDWRDPDRLLELDGLTMVSNDVDYQESHSKDSPDWALGCEARDDRNRVVMRFGGEPPSPFKEALLEGRMLHGAIIARDHQRHGR